MTEDTAAWMALLQDRRSCTICKSMVEDLAVIWEIMVQCGRSYCNLEDHGTMWKIMVPYGRSQHSIEGFTAISKAMVQYIGYAKVRKIKPYCGRSCDKTRCV